MPRPQMPHYLAAMVMLLAGLSMSCRTTKVEKPSFPNTPVQSQAIDERYLVPLQKAASGYQSIQTLEGYANVEIDAPEIRQTLSCLVKIKRNEAMYIVGTIFLGIVAAESFLREDSVFVYVPLQNLLLVGQNKPENIRRAVGFAASFAQASDAFLGIAHLSSPLDSLQSLHAQNGRILYVFQVGAEKEVIELDSLSQQIYAWVRLDSLSRPVLKVTFEEFELAAADSLQRLLPKRIEAIAWQYAALEASTARRVKIYYLARTINPKDFAISFQAPRAAMIRRLEELNFFQR
ncbi:MAG: DUF4292 domain-containing protein [Chloroherpetonaceae bacterium]|nr:DUF4292 domain-containing protein [Chloroherpetonaceae bacterium]MCS7211055.1 DUF4292 domain-containing protein [Chloroherpetonaceae bacterium]MDW8018545.1 DUF4292 domain-containing protein [Chloroherpetonaceae bacterium]MDW8467358.1 DUF4292 domain-containing protein [Chloroherpetonaceae bacterium]